MASGHHWAGWDHDHRISGYWAPKIKAADRLIIPTGKVADTHPGGGIDRAQMVARSAIDAAGVRRLTVVLTGLHVDGAVFGAKTGLGQVRDVGMSSPVPPPGLVNALDAAKTRGWAMGPGLAKHVDPVTLAGFERRADQVAREVAANLGDGVAKILAQGWERGDSADTIARALAVFVDSPARADLISVTETARSMVAGSLDTYQRNGISKWDWLESPGACPICQRLAAGGPYDLNDPAPPGHPRCRCAPVPRVNVPTFGLSPVGSLGGLPGIGGVGGAASTLADMAGVITAVLTAHPGMHSPIDTSGLDDEDDEADG
jgi:SPP1 gp7 family putative phage head morphogenesis protein